jgi:DNA-binding response OmpR family regulator
MAQTGQDRIARRVLVVEDDEDNRVALVNLISTWGHDTRDAPTGAAALVIAEEFSPEVVIIDLRLPDADGCEVARALRSKPTVPLLIAHTASGQATDRKRALDAGFDLFLVKPGSIEVLEAAVSAVHLRRSGAC